MAKHELYQFRVGEGHDDTVVFYFRDSAAVRETVDRLLDSLEYSATGQCPVINTFDGKLVRLEPVKAGEDAKR